MDRTDVYKAIDSERDYQDEVSNHPNFPDSSKSIAHWIMFIEIHIDKAKQHIYNYNREAALNEMRKITALGVACMEFKGCSNREVQ